jgi:ribosomal protein S18 acetylase RimI-like enzyme
MTRWPEEAGDNLLTDTQADQIAELLNTRNDLTLPYTRQKVLAESQDYRLKLSDIGDVIACVQVKRVQWYQFEVLHLTVASASEGLGHGKALVCEAERVARTGNARILQCTIREDNKRSRELFESLGFRHVSMYFNVNSENNVGVFQKVLEPARY